MCVSPVGFRYETLFDGLMSIILPDYWRESHFITIATKFKEINSWRLWDFFYKDKPTHISAVCARLCQCHLKIRSWYVPRVKQNTWQRFCRTKTSEKNATWNAASGLILVSRIKCQICLISAEIDAKWHITLWSWQTHLPFQSHEIWSQT